MLLACLGVLALGGTAQHATHVTEGGPCVQGYAGVLDRQVVRAVETIHSRSDDVFHRVIVP